jgi:hypothetical protein
MSLCALQVAVCIVVMVLSISAIALDWAYFYHSAGVHYVGEAPGGGGGGGPVSVTIHRGDGMGLTILKAVIGSVLGFLVVNFLKVEQPQLRSL